MPSSSLAGASPSPSGLRSSGHQFTPGSGIGVYSGPNYYNSYSSDSSALYSRVSQGFTSCISKLKAVQCVKCTDFGLILNFRLKPIISYKNIYMYNTQSALLYPAIKITKHHCKNMFYILFVMYCKMSQRCYSRGIEQMILKTSALQEPLIVTGNW